MLSRTKLQKHILQDIDYNWANRIMKILHIQLLIISFTGILIRLLNSLAETNSVAVMVFFSSSCISSSFSRASLAASLFCFRYLTDLDLDVSLSLERVSLI